MNPNYIALAVPLFFLLIGIELGVAARRRHAAYRFADAITDLGCGISQRIVLIFIGGLLLLAYVALYEHARLIDVGRWPVASWLVALVAVDFAYYWWHRASHRMNFLWAAHVVHHQSEDYNLAVALRQGVLTPVTSLPFALPLALIGIPPLVYLAAASLNTLYQFWIHTELIGRLGPLERVLNTPSHHRVHHARNPGYLDRNYGAVLILWDKLFGTFVPEREPPHYGITRPLRSFNSLWAQVQPIAELTALSRTAPTWRDRLEVWLAPPERTFPWAPTTPPAAADKYDVPLSRTARRYVLVNFVLAIATTSALMLWSAALPSALLVTAALLVLLTVLSLGGLMESRRWARPLEALRLAAVAATACWMLLLH
jgi:sterol desaturase/sphingolipid hydroxylase (fatty acid hydroxylase superfamily)